MSPDSGLKLLIVVTAVGFGVNVVSLLGMALPAKSLPQLVSFRIGDTAALMGCVAASRPLSRRSS